MLFGERGHVFAEASWTCTKPKAKLLPPNFMTTEAISPLIYTCGEAAESSQHFLEGEFYA